MTSHPTVYVDGDFSSGEAQSALEALDLWTHDVQGLAFETRIVSHAELITRASGGQGMNEVYLLANHGKNDTADCPTVPGVPDGEAAWTFPSSDHPMVCVDVDDTRRGTDGAFGLAYSDYFRYLVAHETGHVMGLSHSVDTADIMFPHSGGFPAKPTCGDAGRMAMHLGLGVKSCD